MSNEKEHIKLLLDLLDDCADFLLSGQFEDEEGWTDERAHEISDAIDEAFALIKPAVNQ